MTPKKTHNNTPTSPHMETPKDFTTLKKQHLQESGIKKIVELKRGMNNSRLLFDWSHLC